jgi:hypothetical protein
LADRKPNRLTNLKTNNMTRKAFIADVATARNSTIGDIEGVQIGDEGEDFTFVFTTVSGDSVLIKALATGKFKFWCNFTSSRIYSQVPIITLTWQPLLPLIAPVHCHFFAN